MGHAIAILVCLAMEVWMSYTYITLHVKQAASSVIRRMIETAVQCEPHVQNEKNLDHATGSPGAIR